MLCHIVYVILAVILNEFHSFAGAQGIGVCYGRNSSKLPLARKVISLCKSNNIQRIHLYDPNHDALYALRNTGIQVILGVADGDIIRMAQNKRFTKYWVALNVLRYAAYINFRCIAVGHGIIPGDPLQEHVLPAMQELQHALNFFNLSIAVSTLVRQNVLTTTFPPSAGTFGGPDPNPVVPVVEFLESNRYPLLVMGYSYYEFVSDPAYIDFPIEYALLNTTKVVVQDGNLGYTNILDGFVDTFYSALEKAGAPNVEIIVAETGWPSGSGDYRACLINAQTYNGNLIKRLRSNTGTPKRPRRGLESYIYSLFTQDLLGSFLEHYGLFYPNMTAVYPLNFWYSPPN